MPSGRSNRYATPTSLGVCLRGFEAGVVDRLAVLAFQIRNVLEHPVAVRFEGVVVLVEPHPHVDFPDVVVLADLVDVTSTPPRRWLLPAALARSSKRNFSCRPGTRAFSLPWSDVILVDAARRQRERQHDFGRLRARRDFDVERRVRLTHGQRWPASSVAATSAAGCEIAIGRSRGSQATSSCSLSDLRSG